MNNATQAKIQFGNVVTSFAFSRLEASEWWSFNKLSKSLSRIHLSIHNIIELKSKAVISFQTVSVLPMKMPQTNQTIFGANAEVKLFDGRKCFENHHNWIDWTCCTSNDKENEIGCISCFAMLPFKCKPTSICMSQSFALMWISSSFIRFDSSTYSFQLSCSTAKWQDMMSIPAKWTTDTNWFCSHFCFGKITQKHNEIDTVETSTRLSVQVNARCNSNTSNEVIAVISNLNGNPKATKLYSL